MANTVTFLVAINLQEICSPILYKSPWGYGLALIVVPIKVIRFRT